jgi:hypothetical protein
MIICSLRQSKGLLVAGVPFIHRKSEFQGDTILAQAVVPVLLELRYLVDGPGYRRLTDW